MSTQLVDETVGKVEKIYDTIKQFNFRYINL